MKENLVIITQADITDRKPLGKSHFFYWKIGQIGINLGGSELKQFGLIRGKKPIQKQQNRYWNKELLTSQDSYKIRCISGGPSNAAHKRVPNSKDTLDFDSIDSI